MFTSKELRLIRSAIETEIIRREENPHANHAKICEYENLIDKVCDLIKSESSFKEETYEEI